MLVYGFDIEDNIFDCHYYNWIYVWELLTRTRMMDLIANKDNYSNNDVSHWNIVLDLKKCVLQRSYLIDLYITPQNVGCYHHIYPNFSQTVVNTDCFWTCASVIEIVDALLNCKDTTCKVLIGLSMRERC